MRFFRNLVILLILSTLTILFFQPARSSAESALPGEARISFLDVGQGDAALLQGPDGFDVLIDGGPAAAGPTVVAFLRQNGVDDLELMIVSHAHDDHYGGLTAVLRATDIPIEALVINPYADDSHEWNNFLAAAGERQLTPTPMAASAPVDWGEGFRAEALYPPSNLINPDLNNAGLIFRINHGPITLLFTADVGFSTENSLLQSGAPLDADILKVAHHGSSSSSSVDFLNAITPRNAIISVGANNPYGHPADLTIDRLHAVQAQIWRTDQYGTITIHSDGSTYSLETEHTLLHLFLPVIFNTLP